MPVTGLQRRKQEPHSGMQRHQVLSVVPYHNTDSVSKLIITSFHTVANKYFATVLDACWRSVVFIKPQPIRLQKKTLVSAE